MKKIKTVGFITFSLILFFGAVVELLKVFRNSDRTDVCSIKDSFQVSDNKSSTAH